MATRARCDSVFPGYERCSAGKDISADDPFTTNAVTEPEPVSDHMAFERVFGTYELGQLIFSFLSAKDILDAQSACSRFDMHVKAIKHEYSLSDPINRFVTDGSTRFTRTNFLSDLICPRAQLKTKHFYSVHQLPLKKTESEAQEQSMWEPWRDMVFTRPPTSTVHVLTGTTTTQSYLPNLKSAEDIRATDAIMPGYSRVVNRAGVTLGEVIDAAELGDQSELVAVMLGDVDEAEVAAARTEFHDLVRRERKLREIAVLRTAQLMFSDW